MNLNLTAVIANVNKRMSCGTFQMFTDAVTSGVLKALAYCLPLLRHKLVPNSVMHLRRLVYLHSSD